ncbi:MAG TPA: FMN-binding protein [Chloroflexota bacterium]|nr:FMN-binding protein [Chloroflexota bacterium]
MAKRMSKRLIALSSAAIASVYGIGYVATQPAAAQMASGAESATSAGSVQNVATQPSSSASAVPATSPSASPSAPATAAPSSSGLKDGTYSGTGNSRHGSVSVNVTIQNGKIVSAPITHVTTRYSQNVIAGLPAEVVKAQSAQVNMVSGATDSSMAYEGAVAQALAQAGGAPASSSNSGGSVQVTGPNGTIYSNPPQGDSGRGRFRRGGGGNFRD